MVYDPRCITKPANSPASWLDSFHSPLLAGVIFLKALSMSDQHCPVCDESVKPSARYPNYICESCLAGGVEQDGANVDLVDLGVYSQVNVPCVVKGIECIANEARFGGVVVQPI